VYVKRIPGFILKEICHNTAQMLPTNEPTLDSAAEAEIERIEATRELRQENKG
jgi:hypothetical protein